MSFNEMLVFLMADLLCPLNQSLYVRPNLVLTRSRKIFIGDVRPRETEYLLVFISRLSERVTRTL